jgi:cyclopropane fatty-acyl-phospholipid synthase-like methyltransferase
MLMDRSDWLRERRRTAEVRMDTLFGPIYDENWGAIAPTHRQWVQRFLDLCPPRGVLLDAACGTGKYWPLILASGRTVHGTDQSRVMLDRARAKFPDVPTEKVGLQEMRYREAFDGAICVDAMEFVFPEDWPLVLGNLRDAVKPRAYLYFTVELAAEGDVQDAFVAGRQAGWPIVHGEWLLEGGYHYYPRLEQVRTWVAQAHLRLVEEAAGDEYQHLLVQKG